MCDTIFIYKCNLKNPCNKQIKNNVFENEFLNLIDSVIIKIMHKCASMSASINKMRSVISEELNILIKIKLISQYDITYENDILTIRLILDNTILLY